MTLIEYVLLAGLSVIIALVAWIEFHEAVSEIHVLNPSKTDKTALVVYQKALRDFQPKVATSFAEGLVSNGWKVEITTVSAQTPTDLTKYSLLVLVWPTYFFNPSLPVQRYLKRIGELNGIPTVVICTAAGAPMGSCAKMKRLVQAANGNIVRTLTLFSLRPNEADSDPLEIATKAGKETTVD